MFPLQASYSCQPLPHVNGPTVSEYYELIWLPAGYRYPFRSNLPDFILRNLQGLSSSQRFSPRIPHSLWTPADPRSAHHLRALCIGFWSINIIAICVWDFSSPSSMTGLYQVWGIAVSLAGYVVPCVRFNRFVRLYPNHLGFSPP